MIQHYEQGVKDINKAQVDTVYKLSSALDVTVGELLGIKTKSKTKLTNTELADIFAYCERLSRMVSSRNAREYYGFTFDSAISDTLNGLAVMYEKDGDIDEFKRDEFYGPMLKQIFSDINELLGE